ncbi:MAG: cyclophilin type peptidyl-prolyl cis-trans isomerase [Elusimicrobia bacterium]|nr:MAG: cyclophilin type peptidyl-prolyl cis-trans isomerase [Elusimicrobiota bacterium]KAF0155244.1 MAG: cyclophilin type peptidyl-prolyl cis-trans isomerase [Elusimicrobiota bacterium]
MENRTLAVLAAAILLSTAAACKPEAEQATASQEPPVAHATAKEASTDMSPLLNPAGLTEQAPASFKVLFNTTKGDFTLEVNRDWSPLGADRFYNLVKAGYFTDVAFFRVIGGFMAQFGIHGDPKVSAAWRGARIQDDPVKQSNKRGYVSYAMAGPNTRTTQLFISFGDNSQLDSMGFSPFGKVVSGMEIVDSLHDGYGEGAPNGRGPDQGRVQTQGNSYLKADFPKLDYIKSASLLN